MGRGWGLVRKHPVAYNVIKDVTINIRQFLSENKQYRQTELHIQTKASSHPGGGGLVGGPRPSRKPRLIWHMDRAGVSTSDLYLNSTNAYRISLCSQQLPTADTDSMPEEPSCSFEERKDLQLINCCTVRRWVLVKRFAVPSSRRKALNQRAVHSSPLRGVKRWRSVVICNMQISSQNIAHSDPWLRGAEITIVTWPLRVINFNQQRQY